ncbi:NAD(P)-binding domain-containing protein, partial [Rhizobium sp. TRM95111]|uniref:pyrroline-5-carboxylate reductase family protein n=1 Tax=Rhizobium alarense TaxID=2846851 RepID=UPI001F449BCE
LGVIGGNGWLAGALLRPAIVEGVISPARLVISSRSGTGGLESWPAVRHLTDNEILADEADIVMVSVRPAQLAEIELDLDDRLLISVMAGVDTDHLADRFGTERIIRAMPNACAEQRLSFTPWYATDDATDEDIDFAERLFSASGTPHAVTEETELDYFTALTGGGPAFPALFADSMIRHAIEAGVDPETADTAVRQLFLGAAMLMAESPDTPADIVETFMEYRGTTAAGLSAMLDSDVTGAVFDGLSAAHRKARDGG